MTMRAPYRVAWIPLHDDDASGYGRVGQYLFHALKNAGAQMCQRRDWDWDARVAVGGPRSWLVGRGDGVQRDLVFHTMFEARPLPGDWAAVLNRCAAVWTPAAWNVGVMRESGVTAPIFVSGYGVSDKEFTFIERHRAADAPYVFMWAGTSWGETVDGTMLGDRKGGDLVVEAFRKLNLPDARLILKAGGRSAITEIRGDDRIALLSGRMPLPEYAALMATADCFVYPSRGEGFGLQPLEAMATGLPCIVTQYSGMAEYAREGVTLPLAPVGEEPSQAFEFVYGYRCWWAQISVDDICDRMQWCYEHREAAAEIGKRAAEYVAQEWTWDSAGERALQLLQGHVERVRT